MELSFCDAPGFEEWRSGPDAVGLFQDVGTDMFGLVSTPD